MNTVACVQSHAHTEMEAHVHTERKPQGDTTYTHSLTMHPFVVIQLSLLQSFSCLLKKRIWYPTDPPGMTDATDSALHKVKGRHKR